MSGLCRNKNNLSDNGRNLVDELNIYNESSIGGLCKNCVYGKHTTHPYHDSKSMEKKILEHVHVDI